ncbi:MAG TPA: FKBP-type peptidyl-prolyl cis-trans isomerase [Gammaproteobacteria bacterium]|jgi:FKBP-type peptidyl-prolyl cis-trans isomerase|nr:peptidylprolyl isomerase [Chromatiales bacterium]MCP4927029.1 FKBP-type peptidyl-prolyl cis-trans isomerase [Gammaproteobacteria bacterium]MDP7660311.1 FKBP-type peptidyl-prolyl cis-trans isomerase [Gammaproteobacteria bacterium]HJP39266.1 FKBP-type peptidyl-prolyl cis-trans isomerase [Gammaproteobacteria bacterium]
MKHCSVIILWSVILLSVISVTSAAEDGLETENQKVFYYLGMALSENLKPLSPTGDELTLIERGMRDALLGEPIALDATVYGQKLNELVQQRMLAGAEQESWASGEYIARMAAEEGAMTTNSGIVIVEIVAGTGASPKPDSTVKAHYHGTLRDGTVFDSSVVRGQPFTSSLSSVIPCWTEAIPLIKEGGKSKITCPAELAYGNRGSGSIPGGAALTFEVELIEVVN